MGKEKKIPGDELTVLLSFPFNFWDWRCEIPFNNKPYGTSKEAYNIFKNFWKEVIERMDGQFSDKNLSYVIDPKYASIDRDKIKTHQLLKKEGVSTTKLLPRNLNSVLDVSSRKGVFIKPRYGSRGKGITYLSKDRWFTNYRIGSRNKIENYPEEESWRFTEITGKKDIIKQLLDLEVIVEEEVESPSLHTGKKFDIRAYSIYGKVPHMFIRENRKKRVITSFSQGGTIDHAYKKQFPNKSILLIQKEVSKAANALNSKFLGVDIMFDGDLENPVVLEAQTFTGYPKITRFNLPKYLIKQIKRSN